MRTVDQLRVKIFADGADLGGILKLYKNPLIKGFTTNPTLMRKAGIDDYEAFARTLLEAVLRNVERSDGHVEGGVRRRSD